MRGRVLRTVCTRHAVQRRSKTELANKFPTSSLEAAGTRGSHHATATRRRDHAASHQALWIGVGPSLAAT